MIRCVTGSFGSGRLPAVRDAVQTDNALRAIVTECDALLRNSDRSVSSAAATGS